MASRGLEELQASLGGGADDVEVLEELQEISAEALAKQGEDAPVVRLVNVVLMSAIQKGASDIHIEPYEKELRVRYRIDGILYNIMAPPMKFRDAIVSRIKIMSKLDIAEKRLPQDGRIKIRFNESGEPKEIDFRVSVLPTLFGEKIVLRLLDKDKLMLDMTQARFEPESLAKFEKAIQRPWGMVLVTGPTGSGKTNTLYSSIAQDQHARDQHHDRRGPGRVQPRRHQPGAGAARTSASTSPRRCARSCARTRTSSWSAKSATSRRRKSRSRRRSPATSCSRRCTPTTRRARSTA